MFFKKEKIKYIEADDFFIYGNKTVNFSDIDSIYNRGVSNFINSSYEKRDLYITIILLNDARIELKANTQELEDFIVLNKLHEAIANYRVEKLTQEYLDNAYLAFKIKNSEYELVFENDKLKVKYIKSKRPNSVDFFVDEITEIKNYITLKGNDEYEDITFEFISDYQLFRVMANEYVKYTYRNDSEIDARIKKWFMILFIPFSLNGFSELWFNTSFFSHTELISIPSGFAGMLLSLWIVTAPMALLLSKLNRRKLQREEDFLSGRESSVKDIDFSNFILAVLIGTVIYLVYKQVV